MVHLNKDKLVKADKEKKSKSKNKNEIKQRKNKRKDEQTLLETIGDFHNFKAQNEAVITTGKSKKSKKKKKAHHDHALKESVSVLEKIAEAVEDDVFDISSGEEDCLKGMTKWLREYHESRPGLKVLQQKIDQFIIAHEEKLEQERKENEARVAEDGWTVVVHHKGRKKTTDSESGVTVGSVAPAVAESQLVKKKHKEVGPNFYRFQKREAQRNEILALQSKFEQDRKRIQQLRAARKFWPY